MKSDTLVTRMESGLAHSQCSRRGLFQFSRRDSDHQSFNLVFRDENENFVLLVSCFEAWYSYISQRNVRHTTIFSWASYYRVAHSRSAESRIAYWWVAHSRPGIHNSVQREANSTFEMGFRISVFQSRVSRQEREFLFFSLMLWGLVFTYQTKECSTHYYIFMSQLLSGSTQQVSRERG